MFKKSLILAVVLVVSPTAKANLNKNDPWGIAMGFRIARIAYPTSDKQVSDVIPLLFFDNKYVFLRDLWFGYSLHHRSSIFETSSAFGRIKGGSNYNTLYLQYHW